MPEDVSVVGFDDLPAASQMHLALTTVRQPIEELGRTAVNTLLANRRLACGHDTGHAANRSHRASINGGTLPQVRGLAPRGGVVVYDALANGVHALHARPHGDKPSIVNAPQRGIVYRAIAEILALHTDGSIAAKYRRTPDRSTHWF